MADTARAGRVPSDRTLQRLFARLELNRLPAGPGQQQVFGRFEATRPNELWTGDTLCLRRHKVSYADPAVMPISLSRPCSCW